MQEKPMKDMTMMNKSAGQEQCKIEHCPTKIWGRDCAGRNSRKQGNGL